MAVQAQYPSNALFLNRNGQNRKTIVGSDYSMQTRPAGFLDQSQMLFNNGVGSNTRKRGREEVSAEFPIDLFSLQSQASSSNHINLAQLQNRQSNVVSTGLRLAFEEQNQQKQSIVFPSLILSSILSEDLSAQINQQREEIDQFLQAQGDQLRRTIEERRQRDYRVLFDAVEKSVSQRLREKEAEMEKATRRNFELEDKVAQISVEAQVWQAKVRAQEAMAVSLQAQLHSAMMSGGAQDKKGNGLGCAGDGDAHAEDAESAYVDPERVVSSEPLCKACRRRTASVVVLPCRHFCLCTDCAVAVEACPLCLSLKTGFVEVSLS